MNPKTLSIGIGIAALICGMTFAAQAENIVLRVAKSIDKPTANCPQQITLTETSNYYSGGYLRSGQANLQWLAVGEFSIASTDTFSVTWVAKLKPQYINCTASAGISSKSGYASPHLRMRFVDAKVFLILDMTGLRDLNDFTPSIVSQSTKNGLPTWQWAGTD